MWNNYNQSYSYPYRNNYTSMPYQYPQNNYQYPQPSYPSNPSSQNNIVWVTGKENARSMQLSPNSTMILMDNKENKFYIKTTDDIGLGKLRIFTYLEEPDTEEKKDSVLNSDTYVTKGQLQNFIKEIRESNEQLIRRIEQPATKSGTPAKQPIIIKKQQS